MKNKHSHIPMLVFALTTTIFTAALFAFVLHKIDNSVTETAELEDSIAIHDLNRGREQEIINLYQSRVDDWARLPNLFIAADRPLSFIESLEALGPAASSTVTISQVSADLGKIKSSVKTGALTAHLDVIGSWQALERTLKLAEVMPYQVSIDKVRFDAAAGDDTGKSKVWHLGFELKAVSYTATSTVKTVNNK